MYCRHQATSDAALYTVCDSERITRKNDAGSAAAGVVAIDNVRQLCSFMAGAARRCVRT